MTVKKKRGDCHKKAVRKQRIEDLVVNVTMEMLNDDHAIEAIVSMLMDLQDRENINLPLYEQQLSEVNVGINNLLNAIQQGILTKSAKARLEELENSRDELKNKIALEKLAKPKVSAEFMTFWLHRFRKLDVTKREHRQMLIDAFINAIFLYDDKMLITFNYKEGTKTITFDDVKKEVPDGASGSDLDCCGAPWRVFLQPLWLCENTRSLLCKGTANALNDFYCGYHIKKQGHWHSPVALLLWFLEGLSQAISRARVLPPRMWKWRCWTVWPASGPQLETTR